MNNISEEDKLKKILHNVTSGSLVIGTISLSCILVYRVSQSLFYNIPLNYRTMDIKTMLPVLLIVTFLYSISFLDILEESNTKQKRSRSLLETVIFYVSKLLYTIIRPFIIKGIKNRIKVLKLRMKMQHSKKYNVFEKHIQQVAYLIIVGGLAVLYGLNIQELYISGLIPDSFFLFLMGSFLLSYYLIEKALETLNEGRSRLYDESIELEKKCDTEGETDIIAIKRKELFKKSIPFTYVIILLFILAEEFFVCNGFFYLNRTYKTFNYAGDSYVFINEDDYYHLAKPASVQNKTLIIEMDQYMYIEKDKVLLSEFTYDEIIRNKGFITK